MVTTASRAASAARASSVASIANKRKKQGYKIQYEQVTRKKKRLAMRDTHVSKPPPGYTFLQLGHPELAEHCKELSRKRGVPVAIVYARPINDNQRDPQHVSHHINRVGYHFRTKVFDEACHWLGYHDRGGKLGRANIGAANDGFERTLARYGARLDNINGLRATAEEETQVKKAIRETFPKIPTPDLDEIFDRAWNKGNDAVGNATHIPLSRRVQLATIARIRHTYTNYDRLLRETSWHEARKRVEPESLAKLVEWRGEHDENEDDIEDILRETIVIDDDDNDSTASVGGPEGHEADNEDDTDTSIEVITRHVDHEELRNEPSDTQLRQNQSKRLQRHLELPPQDWEERSQQEFKARWQAAVHRQRGSGIPAVGPVRAVHTGQVDVVNPIHVELNREGKAPRKLYQGGVEYIRITPDREVEMMANPFVSEAGRHLEAPPRYGYPVVYGDEELVLPTTEKGHARPQSRNATKPQRLSNHGSAPQAHGTIGPAGQEHGHQQLSARRRVNHYEHIDLTTPPKARYREPHYGPALQSGGNERLSHVQYAKNDRAHRHPMHEHQVSVGRDVATADRYEHPIPVPYREGYMDPYPQTGALPRDGYEVVDLTSPYRAHPSRYPDTPEHSRIAPPYLQAPHQLDHRVARVDEYDPANPMVVSERTYQHEAFPSGPPRHYARPEHAHGIHESSYAVPPQPEHGAPAAVQPYQYRLPAAASPSHMYHVDPRQVPIPPQPQVRYYAPG